MPCNPTVLDTPGRVNAVHRLGPSLRSRPDAPKTREFALTPGDLVCILINQYGGQH
jgi:hypothetical protein